MGINVSLGSSATFFDGVLAVLVVLILAALVWDRFREPLTMFTGVLALATLALVYVSGLQWSTLDKTDETFRAGQRAFVFPTHNNGWQGAETIDGVVRRAYPVGWENSGNSPTRNLVVKTYCPQVQPLSERSPITLPDTPVFEVKLLLGPKQNTWSGGCTYSTAALKQVRDDGYHLYIASTADYFDIFDKHHYTEVCFEIIGVTGQLDDLNVTPQSSFTNCGRNCADKECDEP